MATEKKSARAQRRTLRGVVVDSAIADEAKIRRERMERISDAVSAFLPLIGAYREYAKTIGVLDEAHEAMLKGDEAHVRATFPWAFADDTAKPKPTAS